MAGGYTVATDGPLGDLLKRLSRIERRVVELERPTGSQVAAALELLQSTQDELADTVADLGVTVAQLADFAKSSSVTSGGFSRTTNGSTTNLAAMPSLSITLDRPARVLVTGSARIIGDAGNSSIVPNLQALLSWSTNYSPATAICTCNYVNQLIPGAGVIVRGNSSVSSSEVISVPAGVLQVNPLNAVIELNGGGGGSAIIQASPITISAVVLPQ